MKQKRPHFTPIVRLLTLEPEILRQHVDIDSFWVGEMIFRCDIILHHRRETPISCGEIVVVAYQRTLTRWEVIFGVVVDEMLTACFGKVIRQSIAVGNIERFEWKRRITDKMPTSI